MSYTKSDLIAYGNAFLSPKWTRKIEFLQQSGEIGHEGFMVDVFDAILPSEFGIHESTGPDAVYNLIDLQSFCEYLDSDDRVKRKYMEASITANNDATLAFDLFDQYMSKSSDADYENWINECVKCKDFTISDMVALAEWLYKNSFGQEFEYTAENGVVWMEKRGGPVPGFIEGKLLACFGKHYFLPSREVSACDDVIDIDKMRNWANFLYDRNRGAYRNFVSDAKIEAFLNQDI